ncbi:MAG: IS1595 family transposase [Tenericutes bacterium]|nr:IS1595 family transposase [Mycoplasmatota bacterium]
MNNLEMIYELVNTICADEMGELKDYVSKKSASEIKATNAMHRILYRERTHQASHCQHCGSLAFVRNGKTKTMRQKYVCKDCHKSFSDTTKSIVQSTKKNYQVWHRFIEEMMSGQSLRTISSKVGISVTTAFHWRHKAMEVMTQYQTNERLSGEIQMDETYFLLNFKGIKKNSKNPLMPRKAKKRGTPAIKRGISNEHVCVLVAMDESDQMITKLIGQGNPLIQDFDKALVNRIKPNGTMVTDSKSAYQEVSKKYKCSLIQIPSGFHTLDTYNLGTLNGIHGEMKQWFQKFKGVSTRHLQKYLSWFRFEKYLKYQIEPEYRQKHSFRYIVSNESSVIVNTISKKPFPVDIYKPYPTLNQYFA